MNNERKRNLLWLSNAPHLATGFSVVARNILEKLYSTGKYDISIVAINYYGDDEFDRVQFPYKYFPAQNQNHHDRLGMVKFLELLQNDVWDLAFTMYDPFILEAMKNDFQQLRQVKQKPFKWIGYYPVDAEQDSQWVKNSVSLTDYPVAYTYYGAEEILKKDISIKDKLEVIYHGVDPEVFFPVGKNTTLEFKRRYFGKYADDETFIITNINRHQIRKDLTRTMVAYKEFKKQVPNSLLYLHAKNKDVGGDLVTKAQQVGLKPGVDFIIPGNFSEYVGVDERVLNMIYNASDVVTSTTLGEGFGLSSIEAMATKTLTVMPDNSALSEILGEGRGRLVKCGSTTSEFANFGPTDKDRIRPLTNVDDLVENWLWAYNNPEEKAAMEEKAYKWAMKHTWDIISDKWVELFDRAWEDLQKEEKKLMKKRKK